MRKKYLYLSMYGQNHAVFKFLKVNNSKTTCSKNLKFCSFISIDRYYKYTNNFINLRCRGPKLFFNWLISYGMTQARIMCFS